MADEHLHNCDCARKFPKTAADQRFGPDRLLDQLIEYVSTDWEDFTDHVWGNSKIEKLLFAALSVQSMFGATEYTDLVVAKNEERESLLMIIPPEDKGSCRLIVRPQAKIDGRFVDFLIHALDWNSRNRDDWNWRSLIVECDGHEFHAATKQQVARDRAKDRAATLAGRDYFRFTGSEIWRDPWGCAKQITDWAVKGFG